MTNHYVIISAPLLCYLFPFYCWRIITPSFCSSIEWRRTITSSFHPPFIAFRLPSLCAPSFRWLRHHPVLSCPADEKLRHHTVFPSPFSSLTTNQLTLSTLLPFPSLVMRTIIIIVTSHLIINIITNMLLLRRRRRSARLPHLSIMSM